MIYDNIMRICEAKGISKYKLEHDAGLSNGLIDKWKEGNPTYVNLIKVANALDVSILDLMEKH